MSNTRNVLLLLTGAAVVLRAQAVEALSPVTCSGPINSSGDETSATSAAFSLDGAPTQGSTADEVAQTLTIPVGSPTPWLPGTVTVLLRSSANVSIPTGVDSNLYVDLLPWAGGTIPVSTGGTCDNGEFPGVIARGTYDLRGALVGVDQLTTIVFEYDLQAPGFVPLTAGQSYVLIFHLANENPGRFALAGNDETSDYYPAGTVASRQLTATSGGCVVNSPWGVQAGRDVNFCLTVNDGISLDAGQPAVDGGESPGDGGVDGSDAGPLPVVDAGTLDSGQRADAGSSDDGGYAGNAVPVGGCRCSNVADPLLVTLLALGAVPLRRRSRRLKSTRVLPCARVTGPFEARVSTALRRGRGQSPSHAPTPARPE
jgi:hypothetical protein